MDAEPQPLDPGWPRYSQRTFPAYRYVPGRTPHPRRDASGHSYGAAQPSAPSWRPEQWASLDNWLFGIDLFNYAYWWEAHEELEALWHAGGRTSEHARFVQGVIKLAAGSLNSWLGKRDIARVQAEAGVVAMLATPPTHGGAYMGIIVADLVRDASDWFCGRSGGPPLISLRFDERR